MPVAKINLFGGFRAELESGQPVHLHTKKAQALFAYLAMRPGQPQPRDKIAALLWGDSGEEQARHSLRQTLVGLRKVLGNTEPPVLVTEGDAISLSRDSVSVDTVEFQKHVNAGTEEALEQAAELYVGDFLEGMNVAEEPFEDWLLNERERLHELAQEALAKLLSLYSKNGRPELAVRAAGRLLSLDPLQEAVHRALMRLYAQQGRREAALKQYQTCVSLLERDLGMEPEEETKQLYEEILRQGAKRKFAEKAAARPTEESRAILVVEDDAVTRTLVEGFLSGIGYEMVHAGDGADALLEMGKRAFDLVLLDLHMPTLDGLKLLEILNDKKIQTPVICLTALTGDEVEVKAFEFGAADFIRKPIQKEVLLMRVRNVLKSTAA
jgi:DNA-binding SARP family transcriptional activator